MFALLSYPFIIEPGLALADQRLVWTWGFALLIAGVAAVAGVAARSLAPTCTNLPPMISETAPAPGWGDRAQWMALAFVPSALLVAVTAFISTDVAAAPLFWVVPLALYLLSFIIVFQRRPVLPHQRMLSLQLILVGFLLAPIVFGLNLPWEVSLPLHLAGFFLTAMVCHGEMAKRRPPARYLTAFYMWMSLGGVLGGLFAGLAAPHLFSTIVEYPLLLVVSIFCQPGLFEAENRKRTLTTIAVIITVGGMAGFLLHAIPGTRAFYDQVNIKIPLVLLGLVLMLQFKHPARLLGLTAAAFLMTITVRQDVVDMETIRSFYGVHKIGTTDDGQFRVLSHGTTLHGAQKIRDATGRVLAGPPEAITYYHASGNISQAIDAIRAAQGGLANVAVVGVGTGSLACRKQAGEHWTFYEIDRAVITIARDRSRFGFMASCAPDAPIVLGDARLTVANAEDGAIDLLIIDAFSSDAIPVHLMTSEAVALYVSKLSPRGSIVFHISNRNMELMSVVAAVGGVNGLAVFRGAPRGKANVAELHFGF